MHDPQAVYVDQVGARLLAIVLSIYAFHVLDAFFTLVHLSRGGTELNPLMDYFLRFGPLTFVAAKLGTAAVGLAFLALHSRFPLVRQGITAIFVLYAGVVGYHLILIWRNGASFHNLLG